MLRNLSTTFVLLTVAFAFAAPPKAKITQDPGLIGSYGFLKTKDKRIFLNENDRKVIATEMNSGKSFVIGTGRAISGSSALQLDSGKTLVSQLIDNGNGYDLNILDLGTGKVDSHNPIRWIHYLGPYDSIDTVELFSTEKGAGFLMSWDNQKGDKTQSSAVAVQDLLNGPFLKSDGLKAPIEEYKIFRRANGNLVAYGKNLTKKQVATYDFATKKTMTFAVKYPFSTDLGDLSIAETQDGRLLVAEALLQTSKILIFDEAYSEPGEFAGPFYPSRSGGFFHRAYDGDTYYINDGTDKAANGQSERSIYVINVTRLTTQKLSPGPALSMYIASRAFDSADGRPLLAVSSNKEDKQKMIDTSSEVYLFDLRSGTSEVIDTSGLELVKLYDVEEASDKSIVGWFGAAYKAGERAVKVLLKEAP